MFYPVFVLQGIIVAHSLLLILSIFISSMDEGLTDFHALGGDFFVTDKRNQLIEKKESK